MLGIVLAVTYPSVITLFRGLGLFQLLVLMLLLSGLWGPLLRSLYIKRKSRVKVSIYIGDAKIRLGSTVLYQQAREQRFWADLKAWDETPKVLPVSNWVKMVKFDYFLTKFVKFSLFLE